MWRRSVRATAPQNAQKEGAPEQSETIVTTQRLKQDVRKWELRRDFLEKKARNLKAKAKAMNAKGDKSGALLHVKKMKLYEKEILKIDGSILQLEEQIIGLEASSLNAEIIEAQELGVNAQRKQMKKVNVERVERLREQMVEMQEEFEEVEELLTGGEPLLDDDSLLDEFEQLIGDDDEEEELKEFERQQLQTAPAPVRSIRRVESAGDEEMATLKRLEMSMRGLLDDLEEAPVGKPVVKQPKKAVAQGGGGQDDQEFAALEAEMLG